MRARALTAKAIPYWTVLRPMYFWYRNGEAEM